jgi:hypothetical protein
MPNVPYTHEFAYTYSSQTGEPFPVLVLQLASPAHPEQALDIDAYLDSGAQRSLFDGRSGTALGLELFNGPELRYVSVAGVSLAARLHRVQLVHPALGSFALEVGFSTVPISRNLLGRDFFNFIQIGFRDLQSGPGESDTLRSGRLPLPFRFVPGRGRPGFLIQECVISSFVHLAKSILPTAPRFCCRANY